MTEYINRHRRAQKVSEEQQKSAENISEFSAALAQYMPATMQRRLSVFAKLYIEEMNSLLALYKAFAKEWNSPNVSRNSLKEKQKLLGEHYRDFVAQIESPYLKYKAFTEAFTKDAEREVQKLRSELKDLAEKLDD